MRLEPATDADLPPIAALVNAAYRGDTARRGWTHEADLLEGQRTDVADLARQLRDRAGTVLLVGRLGDDAAPVASVLLVPEGDGAWHLSMLTVDPDRQNRGLGRRLLAGAERVAAAHGARETRLSVIGLRRELLAWYERRGYRPIGHAPFPVDDAAIGQARRTDLDFVVLAKRLVAVG